MPYLEGPASSLCSFDEGPNSGTSSSPDCDAPDDTSNSSSVVSWGGRLRARADHSSMPAPNSQRRAGPHPKDLGEAGPVWEGRALPMT